MLSFGIKIPENVVIESKNVSDEKNKEMAKGFGATGVPALVNSETGEILQGSDLKLKDKILEFLGG